MKKAITLILAIVMVLGVMSGCSFSITKKPGGMSHGPAIPSDAVTETPVPEKEFELGTVSEAGTYTNAFAGITFTVPENWVFATEEEKEEIMGAGSEMLFGDDKKAMLEYAKSATVYDMVCSSKVTGESVMVMFENTARYIGGTMLTDDQYIDALVKNIESLETLDYAIGERSDVTVGAQEYRCLYATMNDAVQQAYLVRREGKYMICISLTTGIGSDPVELFGGYFS